MSELTATTATPPRAAPAAGRNAFEFLGAVKSLTAQPAVVKSLPLLMFAGLVGVLALLWFSLSSPPSRELFAGLPEDEKAAVVDSLSAAGIDYSLNGDTGAIEVSSTDYHQARMLLASQGLPKSAPDGQAMISSLPLGASRAVEGERLRSAKELDLARTIEAIDAVKSARVHLALDTPSVFVRDRARRAASVMLSLNPGRSLSEAQVQAIVHLVASSVAGMSPGDVSVVDQSGRLLSSGGGGQGAIGDARVSLQTKIEQRYAESLDALLTPIIGAGNYTAEVHADVDFSEVESTREGFPQDASAVAREERAWTAEPQPGAAVGIPGALSNQPPTATSVTPTPSPQLAASSNSTTGPAAPATPEAVPTGRTSENLKRNYAIGREVSVIRKPTGDVKRLTVAVALRNEPGAKPRTRQEIASIEALVKGAVGFNAARGDVVALSAVSFAPVEEPTESWWDAEWVSTLIRSLSGLALAAALFFVGRPLLKRAGGLGALMPAAAGNTAGVKGEAAKMAASMEKELAAALAASGKIDSSEITLSMIEAAPSYEARAVLIRNFVRENPARAALVVRDLLRNGKMEGVTRNG